MVFRLKSENDAAAGASRKRKNVGGGGGGGGGDAGKEERKRFKVVQTDGDAKVGIGMVTMYSKCHSLVLGLTHKDIRILYTF